MIRTDALRLSSLPFFRVKNSAANSPQDSFQKTGETSGLNHLVLKAYHKLTGDPLHKFEAELETINRLEGMARTLVTREDFSAKTAEFKARLAAGESLESLRPEAYAVARQAAALTTPEQLRAYDCQMLGALAMDGGYISEMKTGEGKTLTAVMPLYLNALAGKGAHLITVNDSLAQRDRDQMAPVFEHLGLTVGCVLENQTPEEKRAGYGCDITYTTDRALGFDYLRDRVVRDPSQRVQREPYFALVDEVDEVLLDQARIPLVISSESEPSAQDYQLFTGIVEELVPGQDYSVDHRRNLAWLTPSGLEVVENELDQKETLQALQTEPTDELRQKLSYLQEMEGAIREEGAAAYADQQAAPRGLLGRLKGKSDARKAHEKATQRKEALQGEYPEYSLYSEEHLSQVHYLEAALKARALFSEGKQYVVEGDQVLIIDENKGRTAPGQRYHHGLHQAIEAKEGVPLGKESRTQASITYPNLFKRYPRLAGMSGTAATSSQEFHELYDLQVVEIPTNRPVIRVDRPDQVLPTLDEKYAEVTRQAVEAFRAGRPLLLGTLSVQANLHLAQRLRKAGIPESALQILNTQSVRGDQKKEMEIIAQAGRSGMVTVATNMAGRGQDIKPDLVNHKQLAMAALRGVEEKQATVIDFSTALGKKSGKEAMKLAQWLNQRVPYVLEADPASLRPEPGHVLLRIAGETDSAPEGVVRVKAEELASSPLSLEDSPVVVDVKDYEQAVGLGSTLQAPYTITVRPDLIQAQEGLVKIRVEGKTAVAGALQADQYHGEGLLVICTEHSNSARVDHQFRGRSGRQGDPGETRFVVSLEDDLMRRFAGKGEPSVADVQAKAEMADFEARQQTAEYDDVLNAQREVFGELRDRILESSSTGREKLLDQVDEAWTDHLEEMEELQEGVGYEAVIENDPKEAYIRRGYEAFESMLNHIRDNAPSEMEAFLADNLNGPKVA